MYCMNYTRKIAALAAAAVVIAGCGGGDKKESATTTTQPGSTTTTDSSVTSSTLSGDTTIPTTGVTTPSFLLSGKSFTEALEHLSGLEKPFYCVSANKAVWRTSETATFISKGTESGGSHVWIENGKASGRRWTKTGESFTYGDWVTTGSTSSAPSGVPKTLSEALTWIGYDPKGAGAVSTGDDKMADYAFVVGEETYVATVALSGGGDAGMIGIGVGGFSAACETQVFGAEGPKALVTIPGTTGTTFPALSDAQAPKTVSESEWSILLD